MSLNSPGAWIIGVLCCLAFLASARAVASRDELSPDFRVFMKMLRLNREINDTEKMLAEEGMRICERGAQAAVEQIPHFARRLLETYEKFDASLDALKPERARLRARLRLLREYIRLKRAAGLFLAQAMEKKDHVLIDRAKQKISEAKKVAAELEKPLVWYR